MKPNAETQALDRELEPRSPTSLERPGAQTLSDLMQRAPQLPITTAAGGVGKRTLVEQTYGGGGEAPMHGGPPRGARPTDVAARGMRGPGQPLPYLDLIQAAFGPARDLSGVTAHIGGAAAEACEQLGASAYAHDGKVAFRSYPDLHTATHEASHAWRQLHGHGPRGLGTDGDAFEREADAVADAVVAGEAVAPLLGDATGGAARAADAVQLKPAEYHTRTDLEGQRLAGFETYSRAQADWATSPTMGGATDDLWKLLELARKDPTLLAGCARMTVADLLAVLDDPVALDELRSYGGAVRQERATVEIEPVADVARARAMGAALPELEAAIGGVTAKQIVVQKGKLRQLEAMIKRGLLAPLRAYVDLCKPVLHAPGGYEIASFAAMHTEGVDPATYKPRLPRVRNLHRFEKAALDALAAAETDTTRTKPLTLILHTALDHNGAFHRDPQVTKVATNDNNLTIMIEGKETLADVQSELEPLAKKYGRNERIDQVMFAGHGNARLMELAGTVEERTARGVSSIRQRGENVDLDGNAPATRQLFATLAENMSSRGRMEGIFGPARNHGVVFNACLTGSNEVSGPFPATRKAAARQIKAAIRDKGSLATSFASQAKAAKRKLDVRGANASIGRVQLIHEETGALDLISERDPHVTADKLKYAEHGVEPTGVMRAIIEAWAHDRTKLHRALDRRHALGAPVDWQGRFIYALVDLIRDGHRDDVALMTELAEGAHGIGGAIHEHECRVERIYKSVPDAHVARIFGELAQTTAWTESAYIRLVFHQVWAKVDAAKTADILTSLETFTCHGAANFVSVPYLDRIGRLASLLPDAPGAAPPRGAIILALLDVAKNGAAAKPRSIQYLQQLLGTEATFPTALEISDTLGGLSSEPEILIAIGRGTAPATAAPTPNIDVDRDGTNDLYVEPFAKLGTVSAKSANVHAGPDRKSKRITWLKRGQQVRIIGKHGAEWYAFEHGSRTRFIRAALVTA